MHVLMIGAGGVGDAAARIAAERDFFDRWVVADHDLSRAERTVAAATARREGESRFSAARVDASDAAAVEALAREVGATHVLNAVDPRFVVSIFEGTRAAGADYLDMAMSLSRRHPDTRTRRSGSSSATSSSRRRGSGRPRAGWRSSASGSSRACPTSSRATPRTTCSPTSRSSAPATAPTS